MNSAERKREILKILSQKESVGVEELAELFGVSRVTVRSDLDSLGSKGLLVRTHGGALSSENRNLIRMFSDTIAEKAEEKSRIAQAAAAFLHDGDTVIIDNGSTVMHVAEYLKDRNITVITGSLLAINELMKEESVELIILSGILRRYSMGAIGPLTCSTLGEIHADILFLGETDIDIVNEAIIEVQPKLVIIDSIQTMYSDELSAAAGSVSQVREITSQVMRICKSRNITTIIIGHVTKDGNIAGPRVLEHMVDTVLYLEGERYFSYRILRGVKNRFGSTNEIGMFEMEEEGMCEISNPSDVLISEREDNPSGSCIVSCMEGTRPILVELQALTTQTVSNYPKRTANGIDFNRLAILIAVIEKKTGMMLGNQDVYVNVVGGLKLNEPSIDLGIILVVSSIFKNKPIPKDCVIIGEVGLTGEVRRINMIEKRLKEAEKLGFKSAIIPESNKKLLKDKYKLDIIGVKDVKQAMAKAGII